MTNSEKWKAWLKKQNQITLANRIKYLSEECKVLTRLLNERDKIIDDLEEENNDLKQACDEYDNLMRECMFNQDLHN